MDFLKENFKLLRVQSGLKQAQLSILLGFSRGAWNNYETGKSKPSLDDFIKISKHFGHSASEILETDLKNVHLIKNDSEQKNTKNVHPIVHPTVHLKPKNYPNPDELTITMVAEPDAEYLAKSAVIPITDISVAAGSGIFNSDYIEHVDSLRLPGPLIKKGATYLCVKIKGLSMSPTLQDGGYVIIRHLDNTEWAKMPDERIFVVIDTDGQSYLKRIKNRFKSDFIVLKSDNPDQASFPNFNLATKEINSIWYVEWYLSAKMPNIHDQYYTRLQKLEDKVDNLLHQQHKIKS